MGLTDYLHALGLSMQGQQPRPSDQIPYPQRHQQPVQPPIQPAPAAPQPGQSGDSGAAPGGGGIAGLFKNWTEEPTANGLTALQTPPAQSPMMPGHGTGLLQSLLAEQPSGGSMMGGGLQSLLTRLGLH